MPKTGNSIREKVAPGKRHEQHCHFCWRSPNKSYLVHVCDELSIRRGRVYCYECATGIVCRVCGLAIHRLLPKPASYGRLM